MSGPMAIDAWETGKVREEARVSTRFDPSIKDNALPISKSVVLLVEARELYSTTAQLAIVSDVFKRLFLSTHNPTAPLPAKTQGRQPTKPRANKVLNNVPQTHSVDDTKIPASLTVQKPTSTEHKAVRIELHGKKYKDVYDLLIAIQPQSLLPNAEKKSNVLNTNNVINILALAKEFEIHFLWDECLIFLKRDVTPKNILRHYASLRDNRIGELEEDFFNRCVKYLFGTDFALVQKDANFQRLDTRTQIHLRVVLSNSTCCYICGSDKFPWNIRVTCAKCHEVRVIKHKLCETLSKEFSRLNACRRCKAKMLDVQWQWGTDEVATDGTATAAGQQPHWQTPR